MGFIMDDITLLNMAREASLLAYAPYSKVCVGAAILTDTGKVYTGCNVENSSLGATICAERCAAVKAASEGERNFVKIAVASNIRGITPCGICRQFLFEFSKGASIITEGKDGEPVSLPLEHYLPEGFRF